MNVVKNIVFTDKTLQILETGNRYGNMNTGEAFYPAGYTLNMRKGEFLDRRIRVGKDSGFDGHKMFMADQTHKSGTWFEITKDYVEANPNGWTDIPEDILIVTDKCPGVVIGHPVADCPVVMAYDIKKGVLAISHCSAELVDKKMPMLLIDALEEAHPTKDKDIMTYISACAGRSWTYDTYPKWAIDDIWKDNITLEEDGLYHIDLKKVVLRQLLERNVGGVFMSPVDTISNPEFYSNSAARFNPKKNGRNFSGAFFR